MGGAVEAAPESERTLKQFIEDAINEENIIPLVRLVFEGPSGVVGGPSMPVTWGPSRRASEGLGPLAPGGSAGGGLRASDGAPAPASESEDGGGTLRRRGMDAAGHTEAVIATLRQLALDRNAEILHLCRSNADDIAQSLEEVGEMRATAAEVRDRLGESTGAVGEAGNHLLDRLQRTAELDHVTRSLQATRQAVHQAIQVLQMCGAVGEHLAGQRHYKALKLLQRMDTQLQQGPASDALRQGEGDGGGQDGGQSRALIARLGRLGPFLQERIIELRSAVEQASISDFNSWLVSVRAEARAVGTRALWRAAHERAAEELAVRERRALTASLPTLSDMREAAATIARTISGASAGTSAAPLRLDPTMHPAAARVLSTPGPSPSTDLLEGIDMSLLYRCLQVQQTLGRLTAFQEYYVRNRRLQLNSDLQLPAQLLDGYQPFLMQLAGNFLLEDRVRRSCPALAGGAAVEAMWEGTVACLKTLVARIWEEAPSAEILLTAKDFLLLFCSALGDCGFQILPLQEELLQGRARYIELLDASLVPKVKRCIEEDSLQGVEVRSAVLAAELASDLGLPLLLDGAPGAAAPHPPFDAPFSQMVPQLLKFARGRVEESVAYLAGLVSPSEMVPLARQQRDRMLQRVLLSALQSAVDDFSPSRQGALKRAMQQVANAWCLAQALPALDDFTLAKARGHSSKERLAKAVAKANTAFPNGQMLGPAHNSNGWIRTPQIATSGGGGLVTAWVALCEESERVVVRLLAAAAGALLGQAKQEPWLPEQPPRTATAHSSYVVNLLAYLRESLVMGAGILPCGAYTSVLRALFAYLGDEMIALLAEEAIPAFNMYAIFRLHDDLMAISQFADSCAVPDLAEGLAEPIQLCHLLVTGQIDDLLDPRMRAAQYSALDNKRLLAILPKFREVGDKATSVGHHSIRSNNKQPQSFLRKKSVDVVVKKLRETLVAQKMSGTPSKENGHA